MRKQSNERPPRFEVRRRGGQPQVTVHWDVVEVKDDVITGDRDNAITEETVHPTTYDYAYHTFPPSGLDYGALVSAIINERYDNDRMQAIVNNHLLDPDDASHEAEFRAMQDYRAEAKRFAKEVMREIEEATNTDNAL